MFICCYFIITNSFLITMQGTYQDFIGKIAEGNYIIAVTLGLTEGRDYNSFLPCNYMHSLLFTLKFVS